MPRDKPRLHLALYSRPKHPKSYHYALFISPKKQPATTAIKHHALNTLQQTSQGGLAQPWRYERTEVEIANERRLLALVVVGKVICAQETLDSVLEGIPIYQVDDEDEEAAKSFNCISWAQAAIDKLHRVHAINGLGDWQNIQDLALEYVERKKKQGRWDETSRKGVPTLDLLSGKELVE
ncbi:unnamed protein product [Zymoseptoria tritici ST99CH_1A5]|uniref:Uncharacterized protein n=4 Tax=Zymoseptoria tritici TaxID=1047171 RepID=F9XFA1_ZYMTI|nr:uncharacterized protein MYCGRDRAFT_73824 [Zymoseptoria tritici IPO323]EGP85619.1 hypothetical protein MYCGRDRAFT_73824 [Zymoseptoria tritici IPO323]SMQ52332.1 unnamed protein product [Zymoseptoria tritici ST99CH_3D7]SMR55162.1 unnamed protein product [Zymoseptoria tritici ST99CH_1E4]SMY25975.1 unnamed protein product [Zymoseptoria tritici ST99CH_1A5]